MVTRGVLPEDGSKVQSRFLRVCSMVLEPNPVHLVEVFRAGVSFTTNPGTSKRESVYFNRDALSRCGTNLNLALREPTWFESEHDESCFALVTCHCMALFQSSISD